MYGKVECAEGRRKAKADGKWRVMADGKRTVLRRGTAGGDNKAAYSRGLSVLEEKNKNDSFFFPLNYVE